MKPKIRYLLTVNCRYWNLNCLLQQLQWAFGNDVDANPQLFVASICSRWFYEISGKGAVTKRELHQNGETSVVLFTWVKTIQRIWSASIWVNCVPNPFDRNYLQMTFLQERLGSSNCKGVLEEKAFTFRNQ